MGALRRGVRAAACDSLQVRYSALQVLYCFTTCSLGGFAAIILGYKGLSSTLIGIATGSSCVLSVILMPAISTALERCSALSIPRVLRWFMGAALALYVLFATLPLPAVATVGVFAFANAFSLAVAPFLAQLAMSFNRIGMPINFGLARGLGSLSYALGSVGLSRLVEAVSPLVLTVAYVCAAALFLAVVAKVPFGVSDGGETLRELRYARVAPRGAGVDDRTTRDDADRRKLTGSGALAEVLQQRVLVMVLVGFMVAFFAINCVSVYLIDIVEHLGGDTAMCGVAMFYMAASELPAMMLVPHLRRRFSTGTLFMVVGMAFLLRNMIVVFAVSVPMVFVGLLFQSMSYGLLTPLLTYYIAEVCSPRSETLGQTLLSVATTGVGAMVGTVCGGALQDAFGLQAMLLFVAVSTVVAAAIFLVAGMIARRQELLGDSSALNA